MKTAHWQAIIFDFDGVVVESGDIKTQAFANLYRTHGEAIMAEVARYHRLNGGMSRYQKFHYFQLKIMHLEQFALWAKGVRPALRSGASGMAAQGARSGEARPVARPESEQERELPRQETVTKSCAICDKALIQQSARKVTANTMLHFESKCSAQIQITEWGKGKSKARRAGTGALSIA